jgi:dTDP-4-amino-4,6-dideoxygalactose transaminase
MLANIYNEKLVSNKIIKPYVHQDYFDVYHIYNIRCSKRDELREYLKNNGVLTEIHYPVAPSEQKALKGYFDKQYPIAKEIHETTLSLPISYFHTPEEIEHVASLVNKFAKENL